MNFLQASAHPSDLIAIPENNDKGRSYLVYAATVDGCGGIKNGVWAVNLADGAKPGNRARPHRFKGADLFDLLLYFQQVACLFLPSSCALRTSFGNVS